MWSLNKIKQYIINGIEENTNLDYKAASSLSKKPEKIKEISKDVSAFANSDGGIIIYGVGEFDDTAKRHLPKKLDPVDGTEFSKEWLEQIINSNIRPKIQDLKIYPIQTENPEKNKVIYVIEIPKSNTAHQANDKRYYKRYNFQSVMMEDWEIKDVINRQEKIDIEIRLVQIIKTKSSKFLIQSNDIFPVDFIILAKNNGNKVAKYIDCFFYGELESAKYIITPVVDKERFELLYSNEEERKIKIKDEELVINVNRQAILPKTYRKIGNIKLKSGFLNNNFSFKIQISTEDGVKTQMITGQDLLSQFSDE